MSSLTVVLVCFSRTVVHYSVLRALAQGVSGHGIRPLLLVNGAYRGIAGEEHAHIFAPIGGGGRFRFFQGWVNALQVLRAARDISKVGPRSVLVFVTHPLNILFLAALRFAAPNIRLSVYLHEPGGVARKIRRGLGVPWAVAVTSFQLMEIRLVERVVVSSARTAEIARRDLGVSDASIAVAPLLLADQRVAVEKDARLVLFAGRANNARGFDVFLDVVRRELKVPGGLSFLIATRDSVEGSLSRFGLQPGERLEVHCGRELSDLEIAAMYQRAGVVVLLYRDEVMQSGVPPMAYMHGCAVVGTNRPGVSEDVAHGVTGWLIDEEPEAEAVIDAIYNILDLQPEIADRVRRCYIERYSPAAIGPYLKVL